MKTVYQKNYSSRILYTVLLFGILLSSCANMNKVVYMNGITDTEINTAVENLDPIIHKNDLLSITITSPNIIASQPFNTTMTVATNLVGSSVTQAYGYLVDQDGYIDLPMLGRVKAAGLSKKELKENITRILIENKYLLYPVVNVRYLNFKVTVLGEVGHPMVINVPDEKINIFEALGFAGDMTVYAKRNNVVLIREEKGKRVVKRLDLNSNQLLTSPYYMLQSGDIVYVEPNRSKVSSATNTHNWLPAILSAMSFVAIIVDRLTR